MNEALDLILDCGPAEDENIEPEEVVEEKNISDPDFEESTDEEAHANRAGLTK